MHYSNHSSLTTRVSVCYFCPASWLARHASVRRSNGGCARRFEPSEPTPGFAMPIASLTSLRRSGVSCEKVTGSQFGIGLLSHRGWGSTSSQPESPNPLFAEAGSNCPMSWLKARLRSLPWFYWSRFMFQFVRSLRTPPFHHLRLAFPCIFSSCLFRNQGLYYLQTRGTFGSFMSLFLSRTSSSSVIYIGVR